MDCIQFAKYFASKFVIKSDMGSTHLIFHLHSNCIKLKLFSHSNYQKPGNLAVYPGEGQAGDQNLFLGLLPLLRSAFGSPFDPATLSEEESRLLLAAMVNDYEQMKAREMQKQRAQGSGISVQKRSCNTATCMTHRLVGLLSRSGSMVRSNLLPTKMGFKVFGGRRRNFWI
uniref:Calcitonin receptor-stimulating peptide 1 n=2 Tax=Sus scrofa TaxID=9823 RepID=A0A8D1MC41_PIG